MNVRLINILMTDTGMFDEQVNEIVSKVEGVWLFAEDYGKLYVFENQPEDFDGLYEVLDKRIKLEHEKSDRRIKNMIGVVTPILILANIIIYIITCNAADKNGESDLLYALALNLDAVINKHQFYRLFTAIFIHFGFAHIFSNMVMLAALGSRIEHLIGKLRYIIVYIFTGLAASAISLASCYLGHTYDYAGGASGAIFGLMGVMIALALVGKGKIEDLSVSNLVLLSVLTIINGYLSEGIDNAAHIAGLVAGLLAGVVLVVTNQKVVKDDRI
jgi:rhomboid protease GluP